jgi:2-polyprenyl-3-methyl-5-hydroxy-6-metoxy-1,4-benzoquinol methylase
MNPRNCPICSGPARQSGSRVGAYKLDQEFLYFGCESCRFSFVGNPWLEFDKIYSREYYEGKGADPAVDYLFELENENSCIRRYEWEGLCQIVSHLAHPDTKRLRWLDYGCGHGGLVRYARQHLSHDCLGFDEGYIADLSRKMGIPILKRDDLSELKSSFDLVTAIEVIEHVIDPLAFLRQTRSLLKPGGILFLTTGNAEPWRNKITDWSYASVPEIHVSFFEPGTLAVALEKTGFRAEYRGYLPGFSGVIKFKVLKTLRRRYASAVLDLFPWDIVARVVDMRYGVTRHPIGIAV